MGVTSCFSSLDGNLLIRKSLIALACSQVPQGYNRWTLRLLAEEMVTLEYIESISYETVRQVLKKTS